MWRRSCCAAALFVSCFAALAAAADHHFTPTLVAPREAKAMPADVVSLKMGALRAVPAGDRVTIQNLPLGSRDVTLDLTRFSITNDDTRFVLGSASGPDVPLDFDASQLVFLRGSVAGEPGSRVMLVLSDRFESTGRVSLVDGRTFGVSSRSTPSLPLEPGQLAIYPAKAPPTGFLGPTLCGTSPDEPPMGAKEHWRANPTLASEAPLPPMRLVEIAIDTDYEYFSLFNDLDTALAYLLAVYAIDADIFIRDLRSNLTLSFVRLWDTPDDLFNEGGILNAFKSHWNENMQDVHRDVAQLLSGRRDLGFGGQAFLNGVCSEENGYSVSVYTLGFWGDLETPSVFNRDIIITAHELGHSFGTLHTHDIEPPIDNCNDPDTSEPQRGTIMSYCSQTWTGGSANIDLRFHARIQEEILGYLAGIDCWDVDYNLNAVPDAEDIASGASLDVNLDGIPDEAQDCNGNGILDPEEIAAGLVQDGDENGVPDACEPDCNGNTLPDRFDIELGLSNDAYGDWIPDECDLDCDGDGVSDYNQIQLDMTLDLNRNALLDACEDCDGDGTPDLEALDGAGFVWLAGSEHNEIVRYVSVTGVAERHGDESVQLDFPSDVLITDDRRVLVADSGNDRIVEFTADGEFVGDFIAPGVGGLDKPAMIVIASDGRLLVTSRETNSVLAYDAATGEFLNTLVQWPSGNLDEPTGLTLGEGEFDGVLFVASDDNRIARFDAASGDYLGDFVSQSAAGDLQMPRGIMFLPNGGDLLVASHGTDEILRYDRATGEPLGKWNKNGNEVTLTMKRPWCLRMGPDGNVYASRFADAADPDGDFVYLHLTDARVHIFDPETGNFIRSLVQGVNAGVEAATGFDFLPNEGIDCNLNLRPDSCDIAQGLSADTNRDGVPDECQTACPADANGDGQLNIFDFVAFQNKFQEDDPAADCNGNGSFDILDFICFQLAFAEGCG